MANTKSYKKEIDEIMKDKKVEDGIDASQFLTYTVDGVNAVFNKNGIIDEQMLLDRVERLEAIDMYLFPDNRKNTMAYALTDGTKIRFNESFYKDKVNSDEFYNTAIHESSHILSDKVCKIEDGGKFLFFNYDKEMPVSGLNFPVVNGDGEREYKYTALNEVITVGIQERISDYYSLDDPSKKIEYRDFNVNRDKSIESDYDGYRSIGLYGGPILTIGGDDLAKAYFVDTDTKYLDENKSLKRLAEDFNDISSAYSKGDIDLYSYYKSANSHLIDYAIDSGCIKSMTDKEYLNFTKELEGLPSFEKEDLEVLDFVRITGKDKVNYQDLVNENSELRKSLDVMSIIREDPFERGFDEYDISKTKYSIIENEDGTKTLNLEMRKNVTDVNVETDEETGKKVFDRKTVEQVDYYQCELFPNGRVYNISNVEEPLNVDSKIIDTYNYKESDFDITKNNIEDYYDIKDSSWKNVMSNDDKFEINDEIKASYLKDKNNFKDVVDVNGNNYFHYVALTGDTSLQYGNFNDFMMGIHKDDNVKYISEDVKKELIVKENNDGLTPFDLAVKNNNYEIAKDIYTYCEKNNIENYSNGDLNLRYNYVFEKAIEKDDKEFLKELVNTDKSGSGIKTLLRKSLQEDDNQLSSNIFKKYDFSISNANGENILKDYASEENYDIKVLKALIKNETIDVNKCNGEYDVTVLNNILDNSDMSVSHKIDCIELLKDRNCDFNKSSGVFDKLPIEQVMDRDNNDKYLLVESLVKNGADVAMIGKDGKSSLQVAEENNDFRFYKSVISGGGYNEKIQESMNNCEFSDGQKKMLDLLIKKENIEEELKDSAKDIFSKIFKNKGNEEKENNNENENENENRFINSRFLDIFDKDKNIEKENIDENDKKISMEKEDDLEV